MHLTEIMEIGYIFDHRISWIQFSMLSGTSLSALRALIYLGQHSPEVVSPRRIAEELGESPTYLSKVTTQLVKAGVLRAEKGVKGGVQLALPSAQITMLAIVEACQGTIVGGYCRSACRPSDVCAFHKAALQLETAISETLKRWTLAELMRKPSRTQVLADGLSCVMLPPAAVAAAEERSVP